MIELTAGGDPARTVIVSEERHGVCAGCGDERDLTVLVVLDDRRAQLGAVPICGLCLTAALAIHLAAARQEPQ